MRKECLLLPICALEKEQGANYFMETNGSTIFSDENKSNESTAVSAHSAKTTWNSVCYWQSLLFLNVQPSYGEVMLRLCTKKLIIPAGIIND